MEDGERGLSIRLLVFDETFGQKGTLETPGLASKGRIEEVSA